MNFCQSIIINIFPKLYFLDKVIGLEFHHSSFYKQINNINYNGLKTSTDSV